MIFETSDQTRLFYELKGNVSSSVTVALLNGVMASTSSWGYFVPMLERLNVRILLHDFAGQLLSDKPNNLSFERHCQHLKELLHHLDIQQVHLVGTSYGGEIAMQYAATIKEGVQSITIIDSASELDDDLRQKVARWAELADHPDGSYFFTEMMKDIYGDRYLHDQKAGLAERARLFQSMDRSYFEGQKQLYAAFLRDLHLTDALSNIQCPALVICGQEDTLKPVHFSKLIADCIAGSEFVVVPGSGHVAIFEKPNELNSIIGGFLLKHL